MSRGLGRIQRMCMSVLAQDPEPRDSISIAATALDKDMINESEHVTFRRALRKLQRTGMVVDLGRGFHNKRRYWVLPRDADRYFADLARCFSPKAAAEVRAKAKMPAGASDKAKCSVLHEMEENGTHRVFRRPAVTGRDDGRGGTPGLPGSAGRDVGRPNANVGPTGRAAAVWLAGSEIPDLTGQ